ncbi:UNKNOWN [Stylonychia lemnae]|uniref:Uncharacterized protein n=1 Tax=Stylonychia lemnae TaxID=5949 RepID=A0A078AGN5_STYLE|nr:UNKNOWN [Stylonychia lemnae]|eukprot:CDW81445.1 UNKNOWN [Stylonychia lemnae]
MIEQLKQSEKTQQLKNEKAKGTAASEFDLLNLHKKKQQATNLKEKKELIVEQVIEKKSEELHIPNIGAIEKKIEDQKKVINPFQKSRVDQSRYEQRKQKRDRTTAKNERMDKKRVQKQSEKEEAKLRRLKGQE